jgi:hypothetical protein
MLETIHKAIHAVLQPPKEVGLSCQVLAREGVAEAELVDKSLFLLFNPARSKALSNELILVISCVKSFFHGVHLRDRLKLGFRLNLFDWLNIILSMYIKLAHDLNKLRYWPAH